MFSLSTSFWGCTKRLRGKKVCLCVVLQAKKPGGEGRAGRFGGCLFGSALGSGRNCRRRVGVDRASGFANGGIR